MQIKWSKKAGRALDTALAQGAELFGTHATISFYNRVKSYEPLLKSNPHMGKVEPLLADRTRHQYRSLVIHEHFKLIYYIDLPGEDQATSYGNQDAGVLSRFFAAVGRNIYAAVEYFS